MRRVVHCLREWLPRSQNWIVPQVTSLNPEWEACVVAKSVCNLAEFPVPRLAVWSQERNPLARFVDKVLVVSGIVSQHPGFRHLVAQQRPDLIHSHFGPMGWANRTIARRIGAAHVVSFYGHDATRLPEQDIWRRRYRDLFEQADLFLCEAPHMARVLESLGCPEEKIAIHHLGIDLVGSGYREPDWHPGRPLKILMAGRFVQKKGFPDALQMLRYFADTRPLVDFRVSIVGDASEDPASQAEKQRIEAEAARLGPRVSFLGNLDYQTYRETAMAHDLFLSPSHKADDGDTEGGAPVTILEMMATGLPVLSTLHCDIPYVLAAPNRELLVAEGDTKALCQQLQILVAHPDRWPGIARANRARIVAEFDLRQQGPALSERYEGLFDDA